MRALPVATVALLGYSVFISSTTFAVQPGSSSLARTTRPVSSQRTLSGSDAVLILMDRSPSMASSSKWATASLGVVQALDLDAFDGLDLGLLASPSGSVAGASCVFSLPVECQTPASPQLALAAAGPKSAATTGQRRAIKDWLNVNAPNGSDPDGLPLYSAMQAAIDALRAWPGSGHRILIVVTDGGISCGQLSARPGYGDCNGCDHEWESPLNLVALAGNAKTDPDFPVDTFIMGVPGSDGYDPTGCNQPPYHMLLALSAIAHAGSPEHVPGNCDGQTFTQGGGDPLVPCHYDLAQGFGATQLADAISAARTAALSTTDAPWHEGPALSDVAELSPPRPDPALSVTRLQFSLPRSGVVKLAVYDVGGRSIRCLARAWMPAERYSIDWDLRDDDGRALRAGVYLVTLEFEGRKLTQRITTLR